MSSSTGTVLKRCRHCQNCTLERKDNRRKLLILLQMSVANHHLLFRRTSLHDVERQVQGCCSFLPTIYDFVSDWQTREVQKRTVSEEETIVGLQSEDLQRENAAFREPTSWNQKKHSPCGISNNIIGNLNNFEQLEDSANMGSLSLSQHNYFLFSVFLPLFLLSY